MPFKLGSIIALVVGVLVAGPAGAHASEFRGESAPAAPVTAATVSASSVGTPTGVSFEVTGNTITVRWQWPADGNCMMVEIETAARCASTPVRWIRRFDFGRSTTAMRATVPYGASYRVWLCASVYGGGPLDRSVPVTATVVVPAPVTLASSLPSHGHRYRYHPFTVYVRVPGDAGVNRAEATSTAPNPISWSARMTPVTYSVFGIQPKVLVKRRVWSTTRHCYYWSYVGDYWSSFLISGYPSVSTFQFRPTRAGYYRLTMHGTLAGEFPRATGGRLLSMTRYLRVY